MDTMKLPRAKCVICGKETPVLSTRHKGPAYCSRAHASMARYQTRYRGTDSRAVDRPNIEDKLKKL